MLGWQPEDMESKRPDEVDAAYRYLTEKAKNG